MAKEMVVPTMADIQALHKRIDKKEKDFYKKIEELEKRIKKFEKKLEEVKKIAEWADSKAGDVEDDLEDLTAIVHSLTPEEKSG